MALFNEDVCDAGKIACPSEWDAIVVVAERLTKDDLNFETGGLGGVEANVASNGTSF